MQISCTLQMMNYWKTLKSENVIDARQITIHRNDQILPTKHIIPTFNSPNLPNRIKVAYLSCPVQPYIPRFQMPSNTHLLHMMYILVKSVVLEVPWSVISSLSWMLSLEKNFLPLSHASKLWKWRWMLLPSIIRGRNRTPVIVKWASLLRSNIPLCFKPLAFQVAHYNYQLPHF